MALNVEVTRYMAKQFQLPLKFEWGVFCREILTTANNSNDVSLVGLLHGINLTVEGPETPEKVELPFVVWVYAFFSHVYVVEEPIEVKLSAMISQTHVESGAIQNLEISIKPGELNTCINLNLLMNQGRGLVLKPGQQELRVSFRHKKADLGKIVLPINVTFSAPQNAER